MSLLMCFFFFKQKTAYELRISDWSSDVCSSDLAVFATPRADTALRPRQLPPPSGGRPRRRAADACAVQRHALAGSRFAGRLRRTETALRQHCRYRVHDDAGPVHHTGAGLRLSPRSEEHTSELQSLMRNSY